eukprot:XP_011428633.1 PREDICTED: uncharacterized protein LOC105329147 isoform X1 [Crassostrea gigas]
MGSESVTAVCCLICLLLPSTVMQSFGFISPYWIKHNATSECFRGVVRNSKCPDNVEGLGAAVYGLQTTSFVIIALTSISAVYLICCSSDDGDKDEVAGSFALFVGCLVCLYPVAGILGFSGCMAVVANFGDHDKGWAFYLCLAASCYVILEIVLCCCMLCMRAKNGEQNGGGGESGQEVTQYRNDNSAGGMVVGQTMEHHQIGVSSTGEIIVRKLQFTRIFHIS